MNRFTFDADTHTYTLYGKEIPSVTQIIRFLSADVDKSRPWIRDEAARRGTAVHESCALLDYGEPDALDILAPEHQKYLMAYMAFLRDCKPEWEHVECPAHGKWGTTRFAGTIDRSGTIDGRAVIVDIKTGTSGTKAQFTAQLTGYDKLLNPIGSRAHLYILALSKDGTYKLTEYKADAELFGACVTLHEKTKKKARKTNE